MASTVSNRRAKAQSRLRLTIELRNRNIPASLSRASGAALCIAAAMFKGKKKAQGM